MKHNADLIFNCYEKTYKEVLNKEFIEWVVVQNQFSFSNIFVVINNVQDKKTVKSIAENFKKKWIISNYFRVEDHLKTALKKCNLTRLDIRKLTHYIDWGLVCNEIAESEYFVHWDSDVYLENSGNRIEPCMQEMEKNKKILISNPFWTWHHKGNFWSKKTEDFYYTYGFSDQIYLARKKDLLQDIYKYDHIYTSRFPLYPIAKTFEARIDAYSRKTDRIRLLYRNISYIHEIWKGSPYPKYTIWQYIKWISMFFVRRVFCALLYDYTSNTYKFIFNNK